MKTKTDKFNWFYYRQSDGCEDKFICQYLRLDYLLQLLETGKYYVKRRKMFEDANEKYKNVQLAFAPVPVGENTIAQPISIERIIPYTKIADCPTACWSKNMDEKYLMWKCYATEEGACIRTTVHNVIASLQIAFDKSSENKIVCGSMDYKEYKPSAIEESQLFDKDIAYSDEEEYRFYFHCPTYDTNKEAIGVLIPVDIKVMINEIILSPFIKKDAAEKLARMIRCAYNIDVKQSRIKIK